MNCCRLVLPALALLIAACAPQDAPPPEVKQTETAPDDAPVMNIFEILEADGNFTILLEAIEAADSRIHAEPAHAQPIRQMLEDENRYTLFAPPDAAWANVPEDRREELFNNPSELRNLLLGHLVDGDFTSDDIRRLTDTSEPGAQPGVDTILGSRHPVDMGSAGTLMVSNARIESANIQATNGIIHHVSSVLIPPPTAEAR